MNPQRPAPKQTSAVFAELQRTKPGVVSNPWDTAPHSAEELQREYDMLADLFLNEDAILSDSETESGHPGTHPGGAEQRQPRTVVRQHAPARSTSNVNTKARASGDSAVPQVTNGSLAHAPSHASNQNHVVQDNISIAPGCECLITGHLSPASAALVRGYARLCAASSNTAVALLRYSGGTLTLEVIFAGESQSASARLGGPFHNPEDAMQRASLVAPRLLVHVDETHELDILTSSTATGGVFNRAVVLCAADDAAVVATYRTVKRFLAQDQLRLHIPGRDSEHHGCESDGVGLHSWLAYNAPASAPVLGVTVLGNDQERTHQAFARFSRASQTFLGSQIPGFAGVMPAGAPPACGMFRGGWNKPLTQLLELIAGAWQPTAKPAAVSTGSVRSAQASNITLPTQAQSNGSGAAPHSAATTLVRGLQSVLPSNVTKATVADRAAKPGDTRRNISANGVSAALLDGLTLLASRSPYNPRIELAVDDQGVLHLIASAVDSANAVSESAGELLTVASWARDHAAILAMAHPALLQRVLDTDGPQLHVITDDVRDLRGVMSTGVRLHLATPIAIGGRTQWVCREIS